MNLDKLIGPDTFRKVLGAEWALALVACLCFIDTYLIVRYQMNVVSVDAGWVKSHLDVNDAIALPASLSVTFGLLIPGIRWVLGPLFGYLMDRLRLSSPNELPSRDRVRASRLRQWAIVNSNSSAYQEAQRVEDECKSMRFVAHLCQGIIAFSLIGWALSTPDHPPLMIVIRDHIDALPWYQNRPLWLLYAGTVIAFFAFAFRDDANDDYVDLPGHNIDRPGAPPADDRSAMDVHMPSAR